MPSAIFTTMKPLIGITGNIHIMNEKDNIPGLQRDYVNRSYALSVKMSGGIPLIIPAMEDEEGLRSILGRIDGLILSGGYDIQIHTYGPSRMIGTCNVEVPSAARGEEIFDAMTDAQTEIMSTMGIYFTFGMYAVNSDNPVVILMKKEVLKVLKSVSPSVISIHAFHVHLEDSRVHFDVVVDFALTDYAAFRKEASKALSEAFPTYVFQFNIDPDYA